MTETPFFVKLKNRGLLQLEGADRHDFLQGLITNDMRKLSSSNPLYACLLSPQGKFLHDFFVIERNDVTFIDCEGGDRAQDLYNRLNMYRLRADVQISIERENDVYAIFGIPGLGIPDPRHPDMGRRFFEKPEGMEEKPFEEWDKRRIALTLPDGSRDLIIDKSTMDEAHMDAIGAVSYDKGCYVGQELTARMHYRGLGKKHLKTVDINSLPEKAELRSSCGDIGLALVKTN